MQPGPHLPDRTINLLTWAKRMTTLDNAGAERGDEVQDADVFELVCVLQDLGLRAGDRVADVGVDADGDQGAVQGVDFRLGGQQSGPCGDDT
jgi:hypothetical protein